MEKENYNKEQADMAFDMTNILKDTLQTQKGATIFGEGEAAHYCAKLAFEKIIPLQSIISEQKAEIERLREALIKLKPLFDGRKNEYEQSINEALTKKEGNNG